VEDFVSEFVETREMLTEDVLGGAERPAGGVFDEQVIAGDVEGLGDADDGVGRLPIAYHLLGDDDRARGALTSVLEDLVSCKTEAPRNRTCHALVAWLMAAQ